MTTTNLLLIAALLLAVACYVYIFIAAKRLGRARAARVNARSDAPSAGAAAPPVPTAQAPTAQAPAAASLQSEPASPPADSASPFLVAPVGAPDDLMRIKGIGPKLSARLAELGVFHYSQIADWTAAQLGVVDAQLGSFQGRPLRDQWQSQARLLASGDIKAYERTHGKLEPRAGGQAA